MKPIEEDVLGPYFQDTGLLDLVGRDTVIKGTLMTGQLARIDGVVDGEVCGHEKIATTIIIGSAGRVTGDVRATRIIVNGTVQGALRATEKIVIKHHAVIQGQLDAPSIVIEKGAHVLGEFKMKIPLDNPIASPA